MFPTISWVSHFDNWNIKYLWPSFAHCGGRPPRRIRRRRTSRTHRRGISLQTRIVGIFSRHHMMICEIAQRRADYYITRCIWSCTYGYDTFIYQFVEWKQQNVLVCRMNGLRSARRSVNELRFAWHMLRVVYKIYNSLLIIFFVCVLVILAA